MIRWIWLGVLLALAGCGSRSPVGDASVDVGDLNAVATSAPTVAEVLAQGNDTVAPEPAPVAFDHLGRWAAKPKLWAAAGWTFTAATAGNGETSCRVRKAEVATPTSTRLTLDCRSTGLETIENWALNLHPDQSMTVSRNEGGNGVPKSVTLRRCG